MKKIFTLIAAAMMAVNVFAGQESVGVPTNNADGWFDAETKTIHFLEANSYKPGWWLAWNTADNDNTGQDFSAYTRFVVELSDIPEGKTIACLFEYVGIDKTEYVTADADGKIVIELDEAGKSHVKQAYFQATVADEDVASFEPFDVTFVKAYFENDEAPAQTKDLFGSFSATTTNGDGSKTFTETSKSYGWFGAWLDGFDASEFDYFILEIAPTSEVGVQVLIQHSAGGDDIAGVAQAGETILKVALDPERKNAIKQIGLQNIAPGSFTLTAAYFATQDYVDNMAKPTTSELAISGFNVWKEEGTETPRADFDPATGKITMGGGEQGGGGSWWFGSKDCSDFDNFVLELENTPAGGKVVVQYKDGSTDECEFGVGATAVVIPLDADKKSEIQQVWVQGNDGNSFTMTKAYFAAESATPEANIGTIENGISNIQVAKTQNGAIFNLAGQQVSKAVKGVYIQNGKKFVVK